MSSRRWLTVQNSLSQFMIFFMVMFNVQLLHCSYGARGHSTDKSRLRYVGGDDAAGRNYCPVSNRYALHDQAVQAEPYMPTNSHCGGANRRPWCGRAAADNVIVQFAICRFQRMGVIIKYLDSVSDH